MICLANSRKRSGRCVAGRVIGRTTIGGWIRPVSNRESRELTLGDQRFENGETPKVLDIIRVPMIEPRPHAFQTENHLIDPRYYWAFERRAAVEEVRAAVEHFDGPLWENGSSTNHGLNDQVPATRAAEFQYSLHLIEVNDLSLRVALEGAGFPNARRKVRGHFTLNRSRYQLAVTDPRVENTYLAGEDGDFPVGNATLCISLGEPYRGYAYKLIAAIVP